ncbi:MAG: hypothetical protein HOO06_07885 [Bdellovibrionaceae bacterium]|nr:hypothetical protein [Pseudobdellovibrionaceae bacterium]
MKKTLKIIINGIATIGFILPIHAKNKFSHDRSPKESQQKYNRRLAQQLGVTPNTCLLNRNSNCFSQWIGNSYTERITFYKDDVKTNSNGYKNNGFNDPRAFKGMRGKHDGPTTSSHSDGVKFKEGDLIFKMDKATNQYEGYILKSMTVWGTTNEFGLFRDEKASLAVYVNDGQIKKTVTLSEGSHTRPYSIDINDCPDNLQIYASDDKPEVREIVLKWEAPVDNRGRIILPPGRGRDNLLIGEELLSALEVVQNYFSDANRLELTHGLKLKVNKFARKMLSCKQEDACAGEDAQEMFSIYDLKINAISENLGEDGQYDLMYFSEAMDKAKQLYQNY